MKYNLVGLRGGTDLVLDYFLNDDEADIKESVQFTIGEIPRSSHAILMKLAAINESHIITQKLDKKKLYNSNHNILPSTENETFINITSDHKFSAKHLNETNNLKVDGESIKEKIQASSSTYSYESVIQAEFSNRHIDSSTILNSGMDASLIHKEKITNMIGDSIPKEDNKLAESISAKLEKPHLLSGRTNPKLTITAASLLPKLHSFPIFPRHDIESSETRRASKIIRSRSVSIESAISDVALYSIIYTLHLL